MVEVTYVRDKRPYSTRIAAVERRAEYLRGKIRASKGTSYDKSELAGLEHALVAMRRYSAEHYTGFSAFELLHALRKQCALGLYKKTLEDVDAFFAAAER